MDDRAKLGSIEQISFVRPITYQNGKARGLDAYQFYNGVLDFTVLKDKCMDIGDMRYKGINVSFLSKSGLMAPQPYDTDTTVDIQLGLHGGFMFTCGLSNAGAKCEVDGVTYPFHGMIRSNPAENCSFGVDRKLNLYAEGEVRECVLQGRNLLLRRKIQTSYMRKGFTLSDVITNESYIDEPVLLIYHFDFGWPLLDADTDIILPVKARRDRKMGEPYPTLDETVNAWDPEADEDGIVTCRVENKKLGIGVSISYSKKVLPKLGEWRSNASGDYVAGLEPGLCGVEGRKTLLDTGSAFILKAGKSIKPTIDVDFYDI